MWSTCVQVYVRVYVRVTHGTHMPGQTMDPRAAPHKGLPRLGPDEREGGNGRSTKALT